LLMLGGGGYTIRNVARCWTYETSVALECDIPNELPYNDYFEYFGPDFKLHIQPSNMQNQNTQEYLDKIKTRLFENLRMIPHAPGVQMAPIPEDAIREESDDEEDTNKAADTRISIRASDKRVVNEGEFSDSEDENEGGEGRRNEKSHKSPRKKVKPGSPVANMVADALKNDEKETAKPVNGAKSEEEPKKEETEQAPVVAIVPPTPTTDASDKKEKTDEAMEVEEAAIEKSAPTEPTKTDEPKTTPAPEGEAVTEDKKDTADTVKDDKAA